LGVGSALAATAINPWPVVAAFGPDVVVDFLANEKKTATVARVDPMARKWLVLRHRLVGASG
jgi:hypothetical protein